MKSTVNTHIFRAAINFFYLHMIYSFVPKQHALQLCGPGSTVVLIICADVPILSSWHVRLQYKFVVHLYIQCNNITGVYSLIQLER